MIMNLALAENQPLDPFAAWLSSNGAALCERMRATITHKQCEINKAGSSQATGDCRCNGCGGLDNQPQPAEPKPRPLALIWNAEKTPSTGRPSTAIDPAQIDGLSALNEIIHRLYEDPEPEDDFDDVDLDLDDEELLELFPELAGTKAEITEQFQAFREYQTEAPRYAVCKVRCVVCGGYMNNTRERHDDNVFYCLACGWRTGPEYERNRLIQAAGGVVHE